MTCSGDGVSAWMPIATAPRDGTAVLTFLPPLPHQSAGWINIQKFKGEDGWITVGHQKRRRLFQPTHWMSLPAPPQPTTEGVRE